MDSVFVLMKTSRWGNSVVEVYEDIPSAEQVREVMMEATDGYVEARMDASKNAVNLEYFNISYDGRDGNHYTYWLEEHSVLPIELEKGE